MSAKYNDGGPAFPFVIPEVRGPDGEGIREGFNCDGMTLRQFYKSKVAAGLLADERYSQVGNEAACVYEIARYSGMIADALIAEDVDFYAKGRPAQ